MHGWLAVRSSSAVFAIVGAWALIAAVGCGGTVVFDDDGEGGGPNGPGGTGGEAPSEACQALCAARERFGCGNDAFEDCVRFCGLGRAYQGSCVDLADEALRCITPTSADGCDGARDCCADVLDRLDACVFPPGNCESEHHLVGETTTGERVCGSVVYGSICEGNFSNADSVTCTCSVDGFEVGTCSDELGAFGWCCGTFFADPEAR